MAANVRRLLHIEADCSTQLISAKNEQNTAKLLLKIEVTYDKKIFVLEKILFFY